MKYINTIESFYPSLSKQEKKIANYIFEMKGKISYQSLQEIAKKINVGEATIVRFVKKVGFEGFQDLKLQIAKEDLPSSETSYEDYIDNIESNILKTISNTKSLINKEQIEYAISLIEKADKISIYGVGSSGIAAIEMQNRLLRVGKITSAYTDSHFQIMNATVTTPADVIIAISLSGATSDLIDSLKIVKNNEAKIITITNHILSPIAKLSDCILLTAGRETLIDGGSLIAKISQLYVIDILCTGYALKNRENSNRIRHDIAQIILSFKNK